MKGGVMMLFDRIRDYFIRRKNKRFLKNYYETRKESDVSDIYLPHAKGPIGLVRVNETHTIEVGPYIITVRMIGYDRKRAGVLSGFHYTVVDAQGASTTIEACDYKKFVQEYSGIILYLRDNYRNIQDGTLMPTEVRY